MSDTSEEKTHAASPKKLSEARKKGQLPRSSDFVRAVGTCAGLGYLWLRGSVIEDKCREALLLATKLQSLPFDTAVPQALVVLVQLTVAAVGPLLGTLVAAVILASLLANGGFVFSLEPMKLSFKKIDPFEGLKRLGSARSMVEVCKTMFKVLVLSATFSIVVLGMWKTMVPLPICGMGCVGLIFMETKLLMGIGAGALLVGGLIDLLLQRALYLREMRMTNTEVTRESKDQQGAPELKGEQRRIREEAADEPALGVHRATLVLTGRAVLIGLRYVRGETGVPFLVCRAEGERVSHVLSEARALRLTIVHDHVLARQLISTTKLGHAVPMQYFQPVAKAFFAAGLA
ncbi:EscU/YscU/HrcU family type III secretion system export apparatus switch protein [Mesorhizobium sp.]|uniref:EscU/YscU/HrcU family type III secretion system export apparatus switch protein n=1 Tax=Mesorhizobium sp. TaxID=1871066 RepID=UPI000FE8947B|nr:EscU/YscU/HrcU family type III secretion system export apparatus switch protein [Mesorhizobium sp.]RWB27330.1 MAG: EscU/YscU/HrcU family type III secretion system export apparatus switch protein [Mesorhizobium sp.]RWE65369.1 MAG: EscU/YscU/HrcU family type III secretion system export apparatus switch protein [Mesorhizobium sp.]TIS64650.1 MAG: EscU/YscU/HrcU family type III secretion system export apparatus switch protein [Mesorhizobium sp.]TIU24142.1 MAG: EscU/YscU/HrcU family type III secre